MKLSLFIAKRYLFSKKKQNAINIISVISVVGVAIGTSALVIILSVFNGIDLLLQKSADSFTPDLVISPLTGKFSHFDDSLYQVLRNNSSVAYYNQIVEEKALVKYDDKLSPVTIKGVADDYARNTHFEDNIIQGTFQLKTGDTYKSVVGYGLAARPGVNRAKKENSAKNRPLLAVVANSGLIVMRFCFYPAHQTAAGSAGLSA